MGLSETVTGEYSKYLAELSKGRTLIYEGEKYHSYANGSDIAWSDIRGARAGTYLEFILTNQYINQRQNNPKNKPSRVKELAA